MNAYYGYCDIPWSNPGPSMWKCYKDYLNPNVLNSLANVLEVDASDDAAFESALMSATTSRYCTGPSGYKFNGGWYYVNPYFSGYNSYYCPTGNVALDGPFSTDGIPTPIDTDENGAPIFDISVYNDVGIKYISCSHGNLTFAGTDADFISKGCFYLPPNQDYCLSEKKCNWNIPESCAPDSNGIWSCSPTSNW